MSTSNEKKRKRNDDADGPKATIQVASGSNSHIGPVVASFPGVMPTSKMPFQCYIKPSGNGKEKEGSLEGSQLHVAGENDSVELYSMDESGPGCSYLIGVYNKKTNMVKVRPAPLQIMQRRVKALKSIEPTPVTAQERLKARNALGETFGTRKAIKAIHAAERNKVDVSAMEGVTSHIQNTIEANTGALPSKEESKALSDENRLIPQHNLDATDPSEVYLLHGIVPETTFLAIPTKIMSLETHAERKEELPFKRSTWINTRLMKFMAAPKPNKQHIKILLYISAMFALHHGSNKEMTPKSISERMPMMPALVIDQLIRDFAEGARNAAKPVMTSRTKTLLLTHMFALMLRVDGYATDTTVVAGDLSMSVPKVDQLFKSMGCKVETLKQADLNRLQLPESAAANKHAILRVPLEFPNVRRRRK